MYNLVTDQVCDALPDVFGGGCIKAFAYVCYNVELNRITILRLFGQCDQRYSITCKYRVFNIDISAVQSC